MSLFTYSHFSRLAFLCCFIAFVNGCEFKFQKEDKSFSNVRTLAGVESKIGEPFGIAVKGMEVYFSDGENGKVWRKKGDEPPVVFASGFDTPSQIAFNKNNELIVADSGDHTIKKVGVGGIIEVLAGQTNKRGYRDGSAREALFNAPIGIAIDGNKIFIADTYNDRIRVFNDGVVTTLAGNSQGFSDENEGVRAKFNTPTGLAIWEDGKIIVADSGNRRIRVVEQNGSVWTLAGNGDSGLKDGTLFDSAFAEPTAIALDKRGRIYVADGNSIRVIGRRLFPLIETISDEDRGFSDGKLRKARFNRPSGLAVDANGNLLVADSANGLLRVFTGMEIGRHISETGFDDTRITASEFRGQSKPRWTYNPPEKNREIAGTLGEIRGGIKDDDSQAWFHNGLDITGAYGETAVFIKDEKVLRPNAVQNFDTTRELVRMPSLGYIHIRLGRNVRNEPFNDDRFQFSRAPDNELKGVRIPRGSKFRSGEPIGTLNSFNHVHLVVGESGRELNALDGLVLPGASDSRLPTIENVTFFSRDWIQIETQGKNKRIKLAGKTRVVVQAFDQMDGNAARRKLGLYKVGYQVLSSSLEPVPGFEKPTWTIKFDRLPESSAVKLVYAKGSQSGATGETVFRYIVTNKINGADAHEGFLDLSKWGSGDYVLRVYAGDYFGNTASMDIDIKK